MDFNIQIFGKLRHYLIDEDKYLKLLCTIERVTKTSIGSQQGHFNMDSFFHNVYYSKFLGFSPSLHHSLVFIEVSHVGLYIFTPKPCEYDVGNQFRLKSILNLGVPITISLQSSIMKREAGSQPLKTIILVRFVGVGNIHFCFSNDTLFYTCRLFG